MQALLVRHCVPFLNLGIDILYYDVKSSAKLEFTALFGEQACQMTSRQRPNKQPASVERVNAIKRTCASHRSQRIEFRSECRSRETGEGQADMRGRLATRNREML